MQWDQRRAFNRWRAAWAMMKNSSQFMKNDRGLVSGGSVDGFCRIIRLFPESGV
jgi:hypothetical protein